jgi:hypothetical protein
MAGLSSVIDARLYCIIECLLALFHEDVRQATPEHVREREGNLDRIFGAGSLLQPWHFFENQISELFRKTV